MKLIRLQINERFRSLHKGFRMDFHPPYFSKELNNFSPFCFVGLNGSGKSNALEALAAIFYHLECCSTQYLPNNFRKQFDPSISTPDAFELEYFIKPRSRDYRAIENKPFEHIKILKERRKEPKVYIKVSDDFLLVDESIQDYLPEIVVGYSSGENEILSLPFFKTRFIHFDEYVQSIANNEFYTEPENSLLYIDSSMSQAVMLANFLLQKEAVWATFAENLQVEAITEFRLLIRELRPIKLSYEGIKTLTPKERAREEKKEDGKFEREITYNLRNSIESLKDCATCWYLDDELNELVLDYKVDSHTRQAFAKHFKSPFELFRTFQVLLTLNLYQVTEPIKNAVYESGSLYVNETIPQPQSDQRIFRIKHFSIKKRHVEIPILSKNLSDGEHQFLHTMGICLLLQHSSALFLLDEPETHFNPEWRALFIDTLRMCLETSGKGDHLLRDILITSHSPFIISDCLPDNVSIFRRNKETNYEVVCAAPDFNTFGTSINIITNKIFGNKASIAKHALNKLSEFRERYSNGEEADALQREIDMEMGDSIEKHLFLKRLYPAEK